MTIVSSSFLSGKKYHAFKQWLTQQYNGVSAATANIHHIYFLFQWPNNRQRDIQNGDLICVLSFQLLGACCLIQISLDSVL